MTISPKSKTTITSKSWLFETTVYQEVKKVRFWILKTFNKLKIIIFFTELDGNGKNRKYRNNNIFLIFGSLDILLHLLVYLQLKFGDLVSLPSQISYVKTYYVLYYNRT